MTVTQSPADFLAASPRPVNGSSPWASLFLPSGHVTLVDQSDADLVAGFRWHALKSRSTVYAQTHGSPINGRQRVYLNRLLTGASAGQIVDHINRNGLDNRRANLRLVTASQNNLNAPGTGDGYRGVSYHPNNRTNPWRARLHNRHLGYFAIEWEAAEAFNAAAIEEYGIEYVLLNERAAS